MSKVFFEEMAIREPDLNLGIGGASHGESTGRMIEGVEKVLLEQNPDWVIVYGDTNSTLAGALAAVKIGIPVAHIEAGLRSFNRRMPEEINRVLTDHAADLLFTPTATATTNLENEGILEARIRQSGDVMYDAVIFFGDKALKNSLILERLALKPQEYILATIHRAENTDQKDHMKAILSGFRASGVSIVWPVHPRTRQRLNDYEFTVPGNVLVIDPVGYMDMSMLVQNAKMVVTDSGGLQKEAYWYRVPCGTVRSETEWVELVDAGCSQLIGVDPSSIANYLNDTHDVSPDAWVGGIFGDGTAGESIVRTITSV